MTLQEVFDLLTNGELAQLSIGGGDMGIISSENHEKIIPHVNLGLSALYRRFPLKEKRVTFPIQQGAYTYSIQVADINRMYKVFTDTGQELSLNDESNRYSCFTTSLKVIVIPEDIVDNVSTLPDVLRTSSIEVVYWANHPKLEDRDAILDPEQVELELPYTHLEPLLYFIAARMHSPAGSGQFEGITGNRYMQMYENSVQELLRSTPQLESNAHDDRFRRNGWV